MKNGVKIYNRLAREKISQEQFRLIEDITDDLILTEYYGEDHLNDVKINISQILNMDLKNSDRYAVFQYGQSHFRNEESQFKEWKKQEFSNRKCDISLIIVDHFEEKIFLVCAEVKKNLRLDSLYEARQQLISTYIDLNILNSLITYNVYELNRIFFIISEEISIPKQTLPSTLMLQKDGRGRNIPTKLIWHEFVSNTFYFTLDSLRDMSSVNADMEQIKNWSSNTIQFKTV
ncbi:MULTISPECIES: hypothetical protein [Bacillus cereus group]|uniref:Uncharacterized protein n=1 Tax=Bacillus thuringiensis TaxID=1428 RepID=A0A1C4DFW4_BACTU|nr:MULTISPECIES: hypothetical protein [Bacillus cereus group]MED3025269.1 hypothetical protein [Bacillus wiedmannii]OTX98328.1 hypothetical protein BK729_13805 [Bacillus thuringiensis serovar wratislaviensis]OUB53484.1 hypothetical protein BK743_28785 [Bacillus thuringiensis serovar sylvestriensis]SCC30254.1 Protein of unknown function [Bacillus thuringiensis]